MAITEVLLYLQLHEALKIAQIGSKMSKWVAEQRCYSQEIVPLIIVREAAAAKSQTQSIASAFRQQMRNGMSVRSVGDGRTLDKKEIDQVQLLIVNESSPLFSI